ncbi:hypothetical protein K32_08580 [Kaistia sp. 32K]|uniref:PLP-dependent cysteine synthase family protein n=1 Tax=Kaistia sp. 32K TaxID=2795690 RepID=UPI0019152F22|nr:cysteine synthase family protein [Kaistia sp. 32K]BCP52241.1 hypothetical protein K32_08580 [Kaistia sp. 32K]
MSRSPFPRSSFPLPLPGSAVGADGLTAGFPDVTAARTHETLFDLVGNTPLVRVNRLLSPEAKGRVYVKLDQFNIGGSSKDRIGINIVREARASGELKPGNRIVDFGAGNTAIGYALAGLVAGHPVTVVADTHLSPEKANYLKLLGAEILPGKADVAADHPDNWAVVAERYVNEDPNSWWARQGATPYNPQSHVHSTGPEIWHQTEGRITHFVAAIATGGTVSGTGSYLKGQNPDIRVIATNFTKLAEATNLLPVFNRAPGHETLERNFPPNIDLDVIDEIRHLPAPDVIDFGWHVARTEGLFLGISSILSLKIALELAEQAHDEALIVSFSADSGRDYLTREYNAGWLRANDLGHIADKYVPA